LLKVASGEKKSETVLEFAVEVFFEAYTLGALAVLEALNLIQYISPESNNVQEGSKKVTA